MVPMNLLRGGDRADYLNTGSWSKKAIAEARRYGSVNVAATTEDEPLHPRPGPVGAQAQRGRRLCPLHPQRDHRGRGVPLCAGDRRQAAGGGHVLHPAVAPHRGRALRADLCRRPEEHRPGRADHRHRARGPDRPAPGRHPDHVRLQDPRRQRLHVQHPAHLCLVPGGSGVPVAEGHGRAGRRWR